MRGVGQFGDWPEHVTLGLVLLVLAYWRRSKKWMRIAAAMILACALAGVGARVVKIAAGRARPSVANGGGVEGPEPQRALQRFSLRAHRCFHRILCDFGPGLLADRRSVPGYSAPDRLFTNVCRGPLFIRCCLRCSNRAVVGVCHRAVVALRESRVRNPKAEGHSPTVGLVRASLWQSGASTCPFVLVLVLVLVIV